MTAGRQTGATGRRRLPWPPAGERLRLTTLYSALTLLAGGGLIALVYLLLKENLSSSIERAVVRGSLGGAASPFPTAPPTAAPVEPPPAEVERASTDLITPLVTSATLHSLLTVSLIALAVFAAVTVMLAWWMAGRVLHPVSVITETARKLSGSNLHERIALDAPPGQLKELADTFDGMLGRIERLVGAQQRFAANAAHELRTPITLQRAAAEIGLAGTPDAEQVAYIRTELINLAKHSEQMIEGLLLLARSDQHVEREPVALDAVAQTATLALAEEAAERGITLETLARPVTVGGDSVLLERLVHNLVSNALRYNHPGGRVHVSTGPKGLKVSNTGPVIPPEAVPRLFEPFHRMTERHRAAGEGVGLGLSIVAGITRAHDAEINTDAHPGGGLTMTVHFPPQQPEER
ncbi:sensor histidine kinase [Streptomyces sp. x-80]|uniref:sensor histidine kinase n=1 Tax=Streptomyces sp. x-80 TaxID=2789282 RepID=UPI003980FB98